MTLEGLMQMRLEDIKDAYADRITYEWPGSHMLMMEDSGPNLGHHDLSDLILVFSAQGELVLVTERIRAKEIGWFQFLKCMRECEHYPKPSDDTLSMAVTKGKGFVDITLYRSWWHEWAMELTMPV